MNGGYLIVSLQNHDFVVDGGRVYVKDIYKTIANSNYKAVMLCDITLNGERMQNVYSVIERKDNSVILYVYGNVIIITDTDTIEITGNIVTNIRYYNSLDQVPADLPDGSFVAVPNKVFDLTAMGFPVVKDIGETYDLQTDTTELRKAFTSGSGNFSFDFGSSGNKITVHTGTVSASVMGFVSCSTIVLTQGMWIVAILVVSDADISIITKVIA